MKKTMKDFWWGFAAGAAVMVAVLHTMAYGILWFLYMILSGAK